MTEVIAPVANLVTAVYVSSACKRFTDEELQDILRVARRNNEQLDITGMLLYRDGNILQVLEGAAEAVDSVFQKIKQDPRHSGVILILRKNVEERHFSDWRMAFRDISKEGVTAGYSSFLQPGSEDEDMGEESHLIFRLLRRFKDSMR